MVEVKKMMVATRNARGPQPHILLFIHPKVPFLVANFRSFFCSPKRMNQEKGSP